MLEVVRNTAREVFIPFSVGGGIRSIEDIRDTLNAGADKVSVNTAAVQKPELITEGAMKFGSQCIIIAIDARRRAGGSWEVYIHGGRTPTGIDVLEWAQRAQRLGAGEILLTSMDKDGTREGYDIPLTAAVAEATSIPVIASGGAGTLEHLYAACADGKADAVLCASIFHYREYTIGQAKEYLAGKGVTIRL